MFLLSKMAQTQRNTYHTVGGPTACAQTRLPESFLLFILSLPTFHLHVLKLLSYLPVPCVCVHSFDTPGSQSLVSI